eukprot:scaffold11138_cov111-Isochrysis_galbana.AAC.2
MLPSPLLSIRLNTYSTSFTLESVSRSSAPTSTSSPPEWKRNSGIGPGVGGLTGEPRTRAAACSALWVVGVGGRRVLGGGWVEGGGRVPGGGGGARGRKCPRSLRLQLPRWDFRATRPAGQGRRLALASASVSWRLKAQEWAGGYAQLWAVYSIRATYLNPSTQQKSPHRPPPAAAPPARPQAQPRGGACSRSGGRPELNLGDGPAAVVLGPHVRVGRVGHHNLQHRLGRVRPSSLDHGRAASVRRVPHHQPVDAARVEPAGQRFGRRLRHAAGGQVAGQHHRRRTRRHHVVQQRLPTPPPAERARPARRPLGRPQPLVNLVAVPAVERIDPLAHVVDGRRPARHQPQRARRRRPGRAGKPAVQEQVWPYHDCQLAHQQQLTHEAALAHAADERVADVPVGRHLHEPGLVLHRPAHPQLQQLLAPPLKLAVGTHGLLEHPTDPVRQRVGRQKLWPAGRPRAAADLLEHVAQVTHRRHPLRLGHPVRSGHRLEHRRVQLGRRQLRGDPHLVGVPVANQDRDAVRVPPLQMHQRPRHPNRPAHLAALVDRVTAEHKPPAVAQHQVGGAVRQALRRQLEGVGDGDVREQVLHVALDVGEIGHILRGRRRGRRRACHGSSRLAPGGATTKQRQNKTTGRLGSAHPCTDAPPLARPAGPACWRGVRGWLPMSVTLHTTLGDIKVQCSPTHSPSAHTRHISPPSRPQRWWHAPTD